MANHQRVPVDATETEAFTPTALADLQSPPKFKLKAVTRRQREAMEYEMMAEGLRRHSEEDLREVSIDELCRLWSCTEESDEVKRLRAYWKDVDDYRDEANRLKVETQAAEDAGEAAPPPLAPFEHPDHAAVDDLIEKLGRASPLLRRMGADNAKHLNDLPRFAIAHSIASWSGVKTSPRYEGGVLSIESVVELQNELATEYEIRGMTAFAELGTAALRRVYLTEETEKNSSSGPASQQTPEATKATGSASANGKSPASEPSDETPAA